MGLGGGVDELMDATHRLEITDGETTPAIARRCRGVLNGQRFVDQEAKHIVRRFFAHHGCDLGLVGDEQLDGEVGEQAAIDNGMIRDVSPSIGARRV